MDDNTLIILWVVSGYVGAVWLMLKGYTGELIGCAMAAGGLPVLLPAVVGPVFLLAAILLPNKHKATEVKVSDNLFVKIRDIINIGGETNIGKEMYKVTNQLNAAGQRELAASLRTLTEAVMESRYLSSQQKQEHMEVILKISEEASKPQPNKALLKSLWNKSVSLLRAVPDVAQAIDALAPLLTRLLP
jgi:hypothetical protein